MTFRKLAVAVFLVGAFCGTRLRADVTGSILGTVHDSSGAVIGGAQVVATNTSTNLTRETTSESNGQYRLLALPPGPYKVTVTSAGFDQFVATGIDLKVNDQLTIDSTLQIGAVQQAVTVDASALQVETANTQLGAVVNTKQILSLPLNGRSFIDLLTLQAGVAPATSGSIGGDRLVSGISSAGNISVNGQRETANAFLVNGGDVSEGRNLGAGLIPNLDSVQEFRLITNSFDAEYGKFSGSIMNAITKSGTNAFHGDAFEFLRNDALDARNFYDPSKAELRRNQFGYAIGGPFIRNKLFWFTDYQGTRQVQGASTGLVAVPSNDERNGIFDPSTFQDATGAQTVVQGDYWASVLSQRLGYAVQNGEAYSFAGCGSSAQCVFPNGVIPQRGISNVARNILPYIPAPNLANGSYADASQRNIVQDDKMGQRVDFLNDLTGNWSFYYHFDDSNVINAIPSDGGASVPGFGAFTPTRAQMANFSNTRTFGGSQVNEFRLSWFRTATRTNEPRGSFANLSDLGFVTGIGTNGINPSGPPGFPQTVPPIYFNSFSIGVPTLTTFQPNNTWQVSDGFSKVVGRHSLKFGGEFRYLQVNERNTCSPNGNFVINGSETGSDIADFLLGAPYQYTQCSQQFLDSRTRYGGAYIQDSFKAKPNLTFNLGLRWEVSMPWYDTQGKIETIVPGLQSTQFPTAPTGWVVPGDPGIPSTLAPTRYNNFAPRAGMAYSPDFHDGLLGKVFGGPGKSSIRAAYGLFYTSVEDLNLFYEVGDAPFGLYWQSTLPPLMDQPFVTRADGVSQGQRFPFTFPVAGSPANKTLDYSVYLPIQESPGYSIHNRLPYGEDYNISFQRELTSSTILTVSFVGTQGHQLIAQYAANPGNPALCLQLNALGATPACGPNLEQAVFTLPNGNVVNGTRTALGQYFGGGNTYTANIANSNYNSLQISAERKAADMTFLLSYTYGKAIDNASGFGDWVNFTNYRLSRALSSFDVRHNFVASYNWNLPFFRAFPGAPQRLTRGWNLSGITRFSTGFPITIHQSAGDYSLIGEASTDTPNLVGPITMGDPRNGPYFNADAFTSETLGSFGSANRRFFSGPGIINTDIALEKDTKISESMSFQIRGEFFNIFNHTQFNNPSGDFSSDNFGIVTSARDPRIGQVSAKFLW